MCGILWGHRKDKHSVGKSLAKRYHTQKSRGRRGFGFIGIENGYVKKVNRYETETPFEADLAKCNSYSILAHHRFPTSTENYEDATHPIHVSNKELEFDYYVIHNGVLQNEDQLKTKHELLGYEYTTFMEEINIKRTRSGEEKKTVKYSFNDSEALAIELARFFDGKSDKIATEGSVAFICLQTTKKGKLMFVHYGRNSGNPLIVEENNDLFFLKSEGAGVSIDPHIIKTFNYLTGETTQQSVEVGKIYQFTETPKAGFGVNNKPRYDDAYDDDFTNPYHPRTPVKSPVQKRGNLLEWGDDDEQDFSTTGLPTIQYESEFEDFRNSEEYLLELMYEVDALKNDIAKCIDVNERMASGITVSPDEYIYTDEYMDECISVMTQKQKEVAELEVKLGMQGSLQ